MKSTKNSAVNMLGVFLINLSEVIVSTASFGLVGEPKPPKSLLK
ncbi:AgrD family cyclic lactone autoinducer peptide [Clostridium botulinum]|nr:cyclic lactone autoinducer peptide [Clostridium botulinum]MBN1037061.1 cyclic lactone autoinducer peptide [Clostridium botulinum]MBY6932202.1 cyclic lactone autoinducer peptide [Clostridium botulinum]NFG21651.1 cyclic lactone autoinducer peptide [Clostridium botulinum]NFG25255.1 cyclic lactone autoinducer peptide [Clostridium botulinum]NFO82283.1 cyclic lactone autoinducer peptide [Clostridium botulinum]